MCPRRISAFGRAPRTSANPPVFAKGCASEPTIRIRTTCYDRMVTDPAARPPRPPRSESREALELQAIREQHPELAGAVDMHLELLELQRRIQGRVPLPMLELSADVLQRHQAEARPLLRFEDIPLDLDGSSTDGASDRRRSATLRRARTAGLREGAVARPRHETAGRSSDAGSRERRSVSWPSRALHRRRVPAPI